MTQEENEDKSNSLDKLLNFLICPHLPHHQGLSPQPDAHKPISMLNSQPCATFPIGKEYPEIGIR
jgi:hypothetical protein